MADGMQGYLLGGVWVQEIQDVCHLCGIRGEDSGLVQTLAIFGGSSLAVGQYHCRMSNSVHRCFWGIDFLEGCIRGHR